MPVLIGVPLSFIGIGLPGTLAFVGVFATIGTVNRGEISSGNTMPLSRVDDD